MLHKNHNKEDQEIKLKLSLIEKLDILGPVESPISKIKTSYRTRLLIRTRMDQLAQKMIIKTIKNLKISSKIKLTVDVDPINFI